MSEGSETKENPEPTQRMSYYSFAIIFITLILSLTALVISLYDYSSLSTSPTPEDYILPSMLLIIGFVGLASSTYMLVQTRRRVMQLSVAIQPVMTTITCQKCGFKNVREFERGDYVFKQAGPCPKCKETLLVSAIYREIKEKPKKEIF